jgi:hypothetical protein
LWDLVPGEEIPKISIRQIRRCTQGAFRFSESICWELAPVDEFIDAKCAYHVDKRMLCAIHNPGRAVGKDWKCTEENPLCELYQRCLSERVCYLGVFAESKVDIIKVGETDDYETRGLLQGLGAIIPIYLRDGGKMSLMRSKLIERDLSKAVPSLIVNGKQYRIETKPFIAPYKQRTPEVLLSFLNADPEKCAKLLESIATSLLEQTKQKSSSNELLSDLSLGDPKPCFLDSDADLVDTEQIKKLCQDPILFEEGVLRLKVPRKKAYFMGDIVSGKPPHIITYIRRGLLGDNPAFLLSINPNRLNGYEATLQKTMEQSSLYPFLGGCK